MRASGIKTIVVDRHSKGKKRAKTPNEDESELSSPPPSEVEQKPAQRLTKRRKAETKECPVCHELIPIRLLARHSELEASRVDEIVGCIGDLEPLSIANSSLFEQGSSTQPSRRSAALRALHSFTSSPSITPSASMIQSIARNRKQRFTKLREMMVDTDTEMQAKKKKRKRAGVVQVVCPVCLVNVEGDEDVVDAHVESCLAGALEQGREREREIERERERELESHRQELEADLDVDGNDSRGGYVGSVQGTGFHTRRRDDVDVEDDIDIDGDDAALFGTAQFGEQDIVRGAGEEVDDDETVEIEDANEPLVAIIQDLRPVSVESSSTLLCRICLDPYADPTVSTGCWHTCCRECWLRCLGSTKLCPICKRITGATELRRVYL